MKKILITGVAGFIGSYVAKKLLELNYNIIGVDNLNDYYDVNLKENRLKKIIQHKEFTFIKNDISDKKFVFELFDAEKPDYVINLAAQAGVRYSIENPDVYIKSNVEGFYNILEACRYFPVKHLLYASSSSVYGSNQKVPFEESDNVDNPVSLYAATKKSNELFASTYSHLYNIPISGLRFFTVYGPLGRPDMAYFKFLNNFFEDKPIYIYNDGNFNNDLYRDFTYIDDVVDGIIKLLTTPASKNKINQHEVYNIGNSQPESLMHFINTLEKSLSKSLGYQIEFKKIYEELKPGDVKSTYASTTKLMEKVSFAPDTPIEEGLQNFTNWYVQYFKVESEG